MHVGMATVFQNTGRAVSDRQIDLNERALAAMAEPLGFESIWSVEHHFTDYTMCPDVVQFLSFLAGRTRQGEARLDGRGAAVARSDARGRADLDARPAVGRTHD